MHGVVGVMNVTLPDYIRTLAPYVPGKPIEETQREFKLKKVIKLASNENPLGPSPKAIAVARSALKDLHRYPDSNAFHLKAALSKHLRVTPQEIVVGNGSNELIDIVLRTFCTPGDAVVTSQTAFVAYRICAQILGLRTIETQTTPELGFDLDAMARAVEKDDRVRFVFLPNPNNPTGTYVRRAELEAFLARVSAVRGGSVVVVLDYAYWEYVTAKDLPDALEMWRRFPQNVIVLRTFSKIYGLAGLRVGYAIASAELTAPMEKVRQPFNFNSIALESARAALSDTAFVAQARRLNERAKKEWTAFLRKNGVPFWETQGNFVLVDCQKGFGLSGPDFFQACLRRGVIFRPVANYGLRFAIRISFGTDAENRTAMRVCSELLK